MLRLLAVAILGLLGMPHAWAGTAAEHGSVLVINSGSASLSVLDLATGQELRRIPVLREPHHLMLTPDRRTLLVGDTVANELLLLDPVTYDIRRRVPVADPYQMGFSPDGKFLVVNGLARSQVDVYDAQTYALVHRFPARTMPSHLAFAPDGSVVYVTLQGPGEVAAFDLRHMAPLWTAKVGPAPAGIIWHAGKLLVADMGSDYVAVVDPADGRVGQHVVTGRGAHQIYLSPDRRTLYVNNRVDSTTVALDAATLAVLHRWRMPGGPDDIDFAPDGRLWITQRFAEKVAVLDPASGRQDVVAVGRSPHGIFISRP